MTHDLHMVIAVVTIDAALSRLIFTCTIFGLLTVFFAVCSVTNVGYFWMLAALASCKATFLATPHACCEVSPIVYYYSVGGPDVAYTPYNLSA